MKKLLLTSIAALFLATGTMIIGTAHAQTECAGKYEQKVDFDRCMRDWVSRSLLKSQTTTASRQLAQFEAVSFSDAILRELATHAGRARPTGFKIDLHRTAPRNVRRAGTDAIEAVFGFETVEGRGSGVLRLTSDADDGNTVKAWTLLTALDEIKGHEERLGRSRPQGKAYSRDFRGPNWLDLRKAAAEYDDQTRVVSMAGIRLGILGIRAIFQRDNLPRHF